LHQLRTVALDFVMCHDSLIEWRFKYHSNLIGD